MQQNIAAPSALVLPPLKQVSSPNYSSRGGRAIDLVVVHDCEGSYQSAIDWFAQPKSAVSAHIILREDGAEATQMVAFANKAWHVCDFNARSIGVEMAGFSAKGFAATEWQAEAAIVAFLLHKFNLPCRWAQHGSGQGFCSHFDLGAAGGGHRDPTTDNAVWQMFVARVQHAYALSAPSTWSTAVTAHVARPTDTRHDLEPGSVEWVQMRLNTFGATPALTVDGLMGPTTQQAVNAFQQSHGLVADGDAGPKTIAALAA